MTTLNDRHSAGTAAPGAVAPQGRELRQQDKTSSCPSWPRLLGVDAAAAYLGISKWTFIELMNAGHVRPVSIPRPRTAKAMKTKPAGDTMRRKLVDRLDLDAMVDAWKVTR